MFDTFLTGYLHMSPAFLCDFTVIQHGWRVLRFDRKSREWGGRSTKSSSMVNTDCIGFSHWWLYRSTPKIAVQHQCSGIHRIAKWVQDGTGPAVPTFLYVRPEGIRHKIVSHYWNRPCSSESQTFTSLQTSCQNWAAWSPSVQLIQ
jgi:hypothetical protein